MLLDWLFRRRRPTPTPTPSLFDAINEQRRVNGRSPLLPSPWLDSVAQDWANWMKSHNTMTHGDFATRLAGYRAAENIAEAPSASEVMSLWMASPLHRANILGDYTIVGVGIAEPFWCVDFVK